MEGNEIMGKSLMKLHKEIEHKKLVDEAVKIAEKNVERKVVPKVVIALEAAHLLSLRKRGWGKDRGMWLLEEVENTFDSILEGRIELEEVLDQVELEYGIRLEYKKEC